MELSCNAWQPQSHKCIIFGDIAFKYSSEPFISRNVLANYVLVYFMSGTIHWVWGNLSAKKLAAILRLETLLNIVWRRTNIIRCIQKSISSFKLVLKALKESIRPIYPVHMGCFTVQIYFTRLLVHTTDGPRNILTPEAKDKRLKYRKKTSKVVSSISRASKCFRHCTTNVNKNNQNSNNN